MSVRLQCPLGHVWSFAHDPGTTLPLTRSICPTCGRASENVSLAEDAGRTRSMSDEKIASAGVAVPGYELLGVLGRGGMGVVYKAKQLSLNRVVALKMPLADGVASPDQLARFRAEAEMVARLRDPHVLPVFDYGEHEGTPYFSMEFADGGTLAERVSNTLLPPRPAARLVATLARAVHAAHAAGIVHRDLKPANVLLLADGTPKVSDFGLALPFAPGGNATSSGIEGTPAFMAPEQASGDGRPVGPAADIYALGAILYRLLTGHPPFQAAGVSATLALVRDATPEPPRRSQPAVPRDLEAVCLRCLEKSPERRYASAAALADDLDRFLNGRDVAARRPPAGQRVLRWVGRRPLAASALILLVVVAGGTVAYWNAYRRETVAFFADYRSRFGTIVGAVPLTPEEVRHRETSLRFHSRGGRVERIDVVNADGQLMTRHIHFNEIASADSFTNPDRNDCRYRFTYHADGRPYEQTALDASGDVVWSFAFTSDRPGETGHYRDRQGQPLARVRSGATYMAFQYGPDGQVVAERYRDALREPKPDGLGSFGRDYERDPTGRLVRLMYVGQDGKPAKCLLGCVGMRIATNERGLPRRGEYIDEAGACCNIITGAAATEFKYDAWGNLTRTAHLDAAGNPVRPRENAHAYTVDRDDRGRIAWLRFWGLDDKPLVARTGFAAKSVAYDARGYPARQTFYDADGRRCVAKDGFNRMDTGYDDCGNTTDMAYFGVKDEKVNGKDGYHRLAGVYRHGDLVELHKTDVAGTPSPHGPGVAYETREYDDNHFLVRLTLHRPDRQPVLRASDGVAGWTSVNDSAGREIERHYFDAAGKPVANADGVGSYVSRFDRVGREAERRYRDATGNPALSVHGVAGYDVSYDQNGREAEHRYVGLDGKPCRHADWSFGERFTYDPAGQKTATTGIDADGRELASALVVTVVADGGLGSAAGFAVGDVIVACGSTAVATSAEAVAARKALGGNAQPIDIVVRRGKRTLTLTLPAGDPGFQFGQRMVPK